MASANELVFSLDPHRSADVCASLAARGARALAVGGCTLELIAAERRLVGAIISWEHAAPIKIERLALALAQADGVLRRDLDADTIRLRTLDVGQQIVTVRTVSDLAPFGGWTPARAPSTAATGRRAFSVAA
jgi:hypothetical protein